MVATVPPKMVSGMIRPLHMTRKIISNQLWKSLQPLLPPQQPSPWGGRPRLDDYAVLNVILFVLTTGIPW